LELLCKLLVAFGLIRKDLVLLRSVWGLVVSSYFVPLKQSLLIGLQKDPFLVVQGLFVQRVFRYFLDLLFDADETGAREDSL